MTKHELAIFLAQARKEELEMLLNHDELSQGAVSDIEDRIAELDEIIELLKGKQNAVHQRNR